MPLISLFFGIRISINFNDHNPPNFHVQYGNFNSLIDIEKGIVISGYIPNRQLKLVLAWNELHKDELMQNWELARDHKKLNRIEPL